MPNRILREGILTSERIARLAWPEEVFYRRLMSAVDDFGRYYAHPSLLKAALYPLQLEKITDSDIGKWLTALVEAALVRVYPASDGKRYLELLDFRQQVRAKESKYPAFDEQLIRDSTAGDTQVPSKRAASAHLDVFVSGDVSGDGGEGARARKRAAIPAAPGVSPQVWDDWLTLRKAKKAPVTATVIDSATKEAAKAGMTLEAFLIVWCRRGSQGLEADWLAKDAPRGYQKPDIHSTVAENPGIEATQQLLKRQAEAAAKATPPPAAILALRSKTA